MQIVFENIFSHFLDGQYLKISKYKPKNKDESIAIHNQQEYLYESSNYYSEDYNNPVNNNYSYSSTKKLNDEHYALYGNDVYTKTDDSNQFGYHQSNTHACAYDPSPSLKRSLESKPAPRPNNHVDTRTSNKSDSKQKSTYGGKQPQDTSLETNSQSEGSLSNSQMWSTNCIYPIELMSDDLFGKFCDVSY